MQVFCCPPYGTAIFAGRTMTVCGGAVGWLQHVDVHEAGNGIVGTKHKAFEVSYCSLP